MADYSKAEIKEIAKKSARIYSNDIDKYGKRLADMKYNFGIGYLHLMKKK